MVDSDVMAPDPAPTAPRSADQTPAATSGRPLGGLSALRLGPITPKSGPIAANTHSRDLPPTGQPTADDLSAARAPARSARLRLGSAGRRPTKGGCIFNRIRPGRARRRRTGVLSPSDVCDGLGPRRAPCPARRVAVGGRGVVFLVRFAPVTGLPWSSTSAVARRVRADRRRRRAGPRRGSDRRRAAQLVAGFSAATWRTPGPGSSSRVRSPSPPACPRGPCGGSGRVVAGSR
jgi:hypothetical protein